MQREAERVPVVTAFVYSGSRVALVKRSGDVGTYRGAWSGFSGYVERMPLQQARVELAEEAGLSEDQARLTGIGIPLSVDDQEEGRRWLVFPFLFELADSAEIRTDWEAAEWSWFGPDDIENLKTVPGLDKAFRRVWPPFGDSEFWNGLAGVATDTTSSATQLARRGLTILGGYVQANEQQLDDVTLLRAVRAFAACRPVMGVFPDLAARLLLAMEREGGQFAFDELVTELFDAVEDATDLSADEAARGLHGKRRVFTLSYSTPVLGAIIGWHGSSGRIEVVVAESRPRKEGVALAEGLSRRGIRAQVVPDEEVVSAVRGVDAVLVGCDAIADTDELINKVGTCEAVLAAKAAGIPAYAVAQTFKIAPPGWPTFLEQQEAVEADGEGAGTPPVTVFDRTPVHNFQTVYTEEGPLTDERLSQIRTELGSVELIPPT